MASALADISGVCKISGNWNVEGEAGPLSSIFELVDEASPGNAPAKGSPSVRFIKGDSSFEVSYTFSKPFGRCQIFASSNARVVEVYGASPKSTVSRFLFSLNAKQNEAVGCYEAFMPQPRAVPQRVTILKIRFLSLARNRNGPCDIFGLRVAVPTEVLGHNKQSSAQKPVRRPASAEGGTPNIGMLMQYESGVSRRLLAKCEALMEARMQTVYAGVQSAVGLFFACFCFCPTQPTKMLCQMNLYMYVWWWW